MIPETMNEVFDIINVHNLLKMNWDLSHETFTVRNGIEAAAFAGTRIWN